MHALHMADREDIIDLAVRYTWALDTKNVDELRDVFVPDATAMLRGVECNGVDEIIARIGGAILRLDRTQHLVGNHQVDGRRRHGHAPLPPAEPARARPASTGGDNFIVGGYYEDRVVRTADGWRIAHRLMQQTWSEGNPDVTKR